jgi:hypothetical protein
MNCRDYLHAWNDRLDDRAAFAPEAAAALEAHAAACASCRRLAHGLRALTLPMPAPPVPEGMADRILAAWSDPAVVVLRERSVWPARVAWISGLAAAAALALAVTHPWRPDATPPAKGTAPPMTVAGVPARSWTVALAEATSATIDLARETSAPAARVGQGVLDSTRAAEVRWPSPVDAPGPASTGDVLQSVSRRVNDGVRPLSGSARRAFSFLVPSGGNRPARRADDSGA